MFKPYLILILIISLVSCQNSQEKKYKEDAHSTAFERSNGDSTSTYLEVIDFYKNIANKNAKVSISEHYETDSGQPLHLVKFSSNPAAKTPLKILINNGIHPGEPDGIDASMLLFKALTNGEIKTEVPVEVYSIPIYNIGGALQRNSTSRVNQNGPVEYGFRGNAKNYDLNRDFIKSDSKNSKAFFDIFHSVQPHVFVDTHVSNGADYQYTLTHLFTQHNKLGRSLGEFLNTTFRPEIENSLVNKNWEITPYVNVFNRPPNKGFTQFNDSPRYSTGYTSLYNTLGLMIETHMLKPYKTRVEGTLEMLKSIINISQNHAEKIKDLKQQQTEAFQNASTYAFNYVVDSSKTSDLKFLGYQADTIISQVTDLPRLKYNREKPITTNIKYFNYFKAKDSIKIPEAYIIPQQYTEIIDLLKWNNINIERFVADTLIKVERYTIADYNTRKSPYEGHYLHFNTSVSTEISQIKITPGDVIVNTNQPGIRYLLETLEPMAVDSFFNWNFFDAILQQKEGFSPYVFEDLAIKILEENPKLKTEFEQMKKTDKSFKNNWYAQLDWLHKHSPYYETAHLKYPIYRLME
ncbi:M14 family metallopeptidase [Psychroflexus sp. ALD_RP9]|uniref:M14 family metallopeptidase n=1 Tax=Psychroflexus sp. ALD_RP9 TaxID=2777186 RepID=UPI001A8F8E91|nr:M14 family metallopeptidase [Psychroflexus sp. ALD_RP9]QSS97361.1 M14 family metallopeptidase [Psychroflexus sp. ALD_RP9]